VVYYHVILGIVSGGDPRRKGEKKREKMARKKRKKMARKERDFLLTL